MPKRTKKTDLPPTIEELDKGLEDNLKKLEEPEEISEEETEVEEEEIPEDEESEESEDEQESEDEEESEDEDEVEPSPDYKGKFKESSKENQKIYAKNRKLNQAVSEASELMPPTDEEMAKDLGEDWELMSDFEKRLAKDNTLNNKRFALVQKSAQEGEKIEKWNEQVEGFVGDPKTLIEYPELEGKTEDFKEFASEEKMNSIPFEVLIGHYLYKNKPVKNKGKMFESGTRGSKEPTKPAGMVAFADAENLRTTDYKKYKELLIGGKIESPKL